MNYRELFRENRLCRLLGIEYPIIGGGMTWVSDASLCAAVSEAGGVGILAAGNLPPDLLREQITHARKLTRKPIGVNLVGISPNFSSHLDIALALRPDLVTLGADPNFQEHIAALLGCGIKVFPLAASVLMATLAEEAGAQAVIPEGQEAGGHISNVSTMPFIPQVVDAVTIPVIAAGGIGDGRGMAAAFALGAEGIQIGTALIVADECGVHENYKQAVLNAEDRSTAVTGISIGKPVRALRNKLTRQLRKMEDEGVPWTEIELLAAGKLREAAQEGNVREGSVMMGQVAGLIKKKAPAKEIIENILTGFAQTIKTLDSKYI
ncbi:MAG: nitronate monooxygenase [Candidatus Aureabacteria bacterium]|nr:nitronate monooxygenase [Candidatus Auribacterota bacterium]